MNTHLQTRFTALESALDALVDSITSYNPAPAAAHALVAVDDDLSHDLSVLAAHQANHAQLLRLRATTAALDQQIKDSLRQLADTRKELIALRPREQRAKQPEGVEYGELLATAQRIARFTTPSGRMQVPVVKAEEKEEEEEEEEEGGTQRTGGMQETREGDGQQQAEGSADVATPTHRAMDKIAAHLRAWIDPPQGADGQPIYTPWPNENVIRSGALGRIQKMIEEGQDPAVVGGGGHGAEGMETEQRLVDEKGVEARRGSVLGPEEMARRQEERRRLQEQERQRQAATFDEFELYDPDAE